MFEANSDRGGYPLAAQPLGDDAASPGDAKFGRYGGSHGPLERVSVNLTGRASQALKMAAELTGDTRTDTINRALQLYVYVEQIAARGGSVYARDAAGAELQLLRLF
jgi:hypothetical protein